MMNNDMLKNIDYLREKADVSYEEAETLLERYDGNVMRVLVELERQGRVFQNPNAEYNHSGQQFQNDLNDAKEKASSFFDKALHTRLVVEKKDDDGKKETIANLNLPFAAGMAIVAPWVAVGSAAIAFATGHNIKFKADKKKDEEKDNQA